MLILALKEVDLCFCSATCTPLRNGDATSRMMNFITVALFVSAVRLAHAASVVTMQLNFSLSATKPHAPCQGCRELVSGLMAIC
jgi:hypothetical protein